MKSVYILSKSDLANHQTLMVSTGSKKIMEALKDKYNISDIAKKELLCYGKTVWFENDGSLFTFELEFVEQDKFLG